MPLDPTTDQPLARGPNIQVPKSVATSCAFAPNTTEVHSRARRLGIGGPVGSGKTALVALLCQRLGDCFEIAVVTNDIYTTEDADFLRRTGVLDPTRIVGVQTGCCPHTAIRDDIAANLEAVEGFDARIPELQLVIIESGGDNLTATFSKALVDRQIFVVDVAGGDKVPRKGGPGVTRSDLLVINKTDLACLVGADLVMMESDARAIRNDEPVALMSISTGDGVEAVLAWVRKWVQGLDRDQDDDQTDCRDAGWAGPAGSPS